MANNYMLFSEMLPLANKEEREWLQIEIEQIENMSEGEGLGFDCKFENDGLWIYAEESGNVDAVAAFVQYFLKKFHPDKYWTMTWACTCSRPIIGEFDGGAVFVTARGISFNNSGAWLNKVKDRHRNKTALKREEE